MESQEFYIRHATETEARGPFNWEQLTSLAEAGSVSPETLYYDAVNETWLVIQDSPEMKNRIFPEATKLKLKPKENLATLNRATGADTRPPINVGDMLAAAEGRTEDTKDKASSEIEALRAAGIGSWAVVGICVLSAAGEAVPAVDAITSMDPAKLAHFPLTALGAVDLVLAVLIGLGMVNLYPFIRFRAALGFGLFGIIFFLQGVHLPLLALALGSAGFYFCTISITLVPVIVSAVLGLGGIGYVAYHLLSQ